MQFKVMYLIEKIYLPLKNGEVEFEQIYSGNLALMRIERYVSILYFP